MKQLFLLIIFFSFFLLNIKAQQYGDNFVSYSITSFEGDKIGLIDMSREGDHVKVKYFAGRDLNGTLVSDRYKQWARNKKVIAYSSGTYMTTWNPQTSKPVGFCMDNGDLVNNTYEKDQFDGLAIVYATGGIAVNNLKNGDLKITMADGTSRVIDPRRQLDRNDLIDWGRRNGLTLFQTHLFYYKDAWQINGRTSSSKPAHRRFLAVGYDEDDVVHHYIVNIKHDYDIYTGAKKAVEFLKTQKQVKSLVYLINLDTGGQNVFRCFKKDGTLDSRDIFMGDVPLESACNLLVYYYED